MQFNSLNFIFLFLPLVLAGWYLFNQLKSHKLALVWLLIMSLWFYGYYNPIYLLLLAVSTIANYCLSYIMDIFPRFKKGSLMVGLVLNIATLAYFKYRDFFFENVNSVFGLSYTLKHIVLPLGISFFTLQQIAYLVDRYKNNALHYDLLEYALFVTYFPKIMSGPILSHDDFFIQVRSRKELSYNNLTKGLLRFVLGLSKKLLIADVMSKYVEYALGNLYALDTISAWLTALVYSIEIYFDFSGYCDMALGLSCMLGISLPENFNAPYKAVSVKDFWKRWHITLTRFLTKYIYIPLGGNRKGKARWIINTLIVFLVSGLWHGASWNFVIWGALHGIAILLSNLIHKRYKENWLSHAFTMLFVTFAWVVFRIEDFYSLKIFISRLFSFTNTGFWMDWCSAISKTAEMYVLSKVLASNWSILRVLWIAVSLVLLAVSFLFMRLESVPKIINWQEEKGFQTWFLVSVAVLFVWCIISLSEVSTFLYFAF